MRHQRTRVRSALLVLALPLLSAFGGDDGPQPGDVAPEPGLRGWIRRADASRDTLKELLGEVVVLHTFAWNCSPCLRVGIPLAVDLTDANEERGLRVFSITTPAQREETERVLDEFDVRHPVASENPFRNENPYVDASANPTTYVFVIGRSGEVVWRGDPSRDLDECLEAISEALGSSAGRGLARAPHEDLREATREYFSGSCVKARKAAEKLRDRHAKKKSEESQRIAADAAHLIERIDALAERLSTALETAREHRDAPAMVRARDEILARFAKDELAETAEAISKEAAADPDFGARITAAEAWLALEDARPPLFPARRDKASVKFAKALRAYLEDSEDGFGRAEAEAWLDRYPSARER